MGPTCSTISWVRSGEVAIVYRFSDHRNTLYILVWSISSAMQHSRNNVECTPSRWLHWFYSHLKWSIERNNNEGKGPRPNAINSFSTATNQIWLESKSNWQIHLSDGHSSLKSEPSNTFFYNQCPQLKNLTGTCQRHHHCVINTLKSGDFLHELQVRFGVAPRDDTTIHPDICQWQKKNCKPPVGHPLHRLPVALLPLQSPPLKHAAVSTKKVTRV